MLRQAAPKTSRHHLVELLRRKAWQIEDLTEHPVVLGVPIGHEGGEAKAIAVDCGLKTMASVSLNDLIDASPDLKEALLMHALENPDDGKDAPSPHLELLRSAKPVPMSIMVKEDLMKQPVASPVHPAALERCVPDAKLEMLADPFFRANPPSSELVDLVVEAVPGADKHVAAREDFRREQRALMNAERGASSGRGGGRN